MHNVVKREGGAEFLNTLLALHDQLVLHCTGVWIDKKKPFTWHHAGNILELGWLEGNLVR